MISRCSSPMPEMMVCPVSSSLRTWKVGSSSARRCSEAASFSSSALVLGSMATAMTGSGNSIDSSTIGLDGSERVSPVLVDFRPMAAAMSPAYSSSRSSRWLACICRMRLMRSRLPLVEFETYEPALSVPE